MPPPHPSLQTHPSLHLLSFSRLFFLSFFLIFRQRGREGEREGEKHQCVAASHVLPTGDLAHSPGMCPDWESNWQLFGSQGSTQSAEPHQPGLLALLYYMCVLCKQRPSPVFSFFLIWQTLICPLRLSPEAPSPGKLPLPP